MAYMLSRLVPSARSYLRTDGSSPFDDRFGALRDPRAQARVDTVVRKLARGLQPDVRPIGEGAHEARVDHGPGYRVYFAMDGGELVILLLCGDKRRQDEDIAFAKVLWREYKARKGTSGPDLVRATREADDGADT